MFLELLFCDSSVRIRNYISWIYAILSLQCHLFFLNDLELLFTQQLIFDVIFFSSNEQWSSIFHHRRAFKTASLEIYKKAVVTAWKMSVFGVFLVRIFPLWTEYREILRISPYSFQIWKNADRKNYKYGHFSRSR